jgi:hypothetical protein
MVFQLVFKTHIVHSLELGKTFFSSVNGDIDILSIRPLEFFLRVSSCHVSPSTVPFTCRDDGIVYSRFQRVPFAANTIPEGAADEGLGRE